MIQRAPYAERSRLRLAYLRDKRLSWKAKGVLSFCLSLPDHTRITRSLLLKVSSGGKKSVYHALVELRRFGYADSIPSRGKGGHLEGREWNFTDSPKKGSSAESP